LRNCEFYQLSEWFYLQLISNPELPGSKMIFPDTDPDSAKSLRADRIRIHNTDLKKMLLVDVLRINLLHSSTTEATYLNEKRTTEKGKAKWHSVGFC